MERETCVPQSHAWGLQEPAEIDEATENLDLALNA
jgi:hypothetical protein